MHKQILSTSTHKHHRAWSPAALAFALAGAVSVQAGCSGSTTGSLSQAQISDADHGSAIPGFWFLDPFVDVDAKLVFKTFDANANPTVVVDQVDINGNVLAANLATFTGAKGPRHKNDDGRYIDEHLRLHLENGKCDADDDDGDDDKNPYYYVRIDTDEVNFTDGNYYRVRVYANDNLGNKQQLGFADIEVHKSQKLVNKVNTANFVPLKSGHSVRAKFRIDTDARQPCNFVTCAALDKCHTVGACDNATGKCSNPTVTCTALDKCHTVGVCDLNTGACSNPAVTCNALDTCHTAGVCDVSNGTCSNPAGNEGAVCGANSTCSVGACVVSQLTCAVAVSALAQSTSFNGGGGQSVPGYSVGTGDFTIAAWIKPAACDSNTSYCQQAIAAEGGYCYLNGLPGWLFDLSAGNGSGSIRVETSPGGNGTIYTDPNVINHATPDGLWHHVAAVIVRGAASQIYVDGAAVTTYSLFGPVQSADLNRSTLFLGQLDPAGCGTAPFAGSIAEVNLYGCALPAGDIANLFQSKPQ